MKKIIFSKMLAAALLLGLGITVTSCKDENDGTQSEEQKEQEAQQKASNFWDVVGQLVSVDDVTDEYQGKTFEATYGMPDPNNATVRIVNTNDMKTAAQRFANLVGATGIDENTPSYTWSDPEIGSMTYTRGGTPAEWATVNVNIKAVPGLQQIIYREGGEGTNGKFSGKAYYRFGDVVKRDVAIKFDQKKNNDNRQTITEYWICVRPAFGPEGKEDSHWVCVNTVGDKNYKYYKASTGTEYWLPTSMGTDKEDMQNFAELLYAICNPVTWEKNIQDYHTDGTLWGFSGVPFFTDFKKAHLNLHNQYFWQNVKEGWKKANVAQYALNLSNLDDLNKIISNGVRLMYKGYSWWFASSWDCELWEAVYTNGEKAEELNMHHAEYNELEQDMKSINFDVREMGQMTTNYNGYFNGDGKIRWAIRHATGKELSANKSYDPKQPLNGVTPVYRYYRDILQLEDLSEAPESTPIPQTTLKNTQEGFGTYMLGDVVEDEEGSRWFCIAGSPASLLYPGMTDHRATFISFDNIAINGNVATNVVKEADLMTVASRLALFQSNLTGYQPTSGLKLTPDSLGRIGEHVYQYAGVNFHKIFLDRDSTWRFQDYKTKAWYNSNSVSSFFNLAYNDGQNSRQAIARVIVDVTQAGKYRTSCTTIDGTHLNMWQYRIYKHYEVFDTTRMEGPNRLEASVKMTMWQSRWAMSNDKMYLDDVASQQMVNKYAAADKWVGLQQTVANDYVIPGIPRKQAEASARPEDYIWKNGDFATKKTSIFNEPVLFLRVMFVEDNGGNMPNLVSTDGRRLRIVHMQDNEKMYREMLQTMWAGQMRTDVEAYWLDNRNYNVCEGWPKE